LIHERHFTREEAERMLPAVEPLLRALREAKDSLTDAEAHALLADASGGNGGGVPGRQVGEAFLRVRGMLGELNESGIVVRDIDRGLIDFPAVLDGREVYLCWQLGEESIGFWHGIEDGFAGRQPLD
jgi:hypothetical protein